MYSNNQVFIIAEMSANHCGDIDLAKKIIKSAKECGADAVKIQTYTADTLTIDCKDDRFKISGGTLWDNKYLYDLYSEAYTPWEWQRDLKKYAESIGIELFSSPFDKTAIDFLESIDVARYKIASFEAIDIPLIQYAASKNKPMIISLGICNEQEIGEIIKACRDVGNEDITLLKCTSAYPAKLEDMNLQTIPDIKHKFGVKVGLSDHTMHIETTVAAVALGATVVEKHFTLDRALGGADAGFSLNPDELTATITAIRHTEKLLGRVNYDVNKKNRKFARSLFVCEDMQRGDIVNEKNVRSIRPSDGCLPKFLPQILGKKVKQNLKIGTPMQLDYIDE
jgi:pseudaminic acid synthase